MADLSTDTQVVGEHGSWIAKISEDWQLWGPNGGYLATIALRAAGMHASSGDAPAMRPASLECHFLRTPQAGDVELATQTLRTTRRAHSVRVSMRQDGQAILDALVWTVAHDLDGLARRTVVPPSTPGPESLVSLNDLMPPDRRITDVFWQHLEERPVDQEEHVLWPDQPKIDPVRRSWVRFQPVPRYEDIFVDAGRSIIAADVYPFLAATIVLSREQYTHIAQTLSLCMSFHGLDPQSEWLFVRSESPFSGDGLLNGRTMIWTENGELAATGEAQMLCRPMR